MALGSFFHGLLWGMLVLCSSNKNPDVLVQQTRGPIYVQNGTVLTLECNVTGRFRPELVTWFKGTGARRKLIFSNHAVRDRVARKDEDSETDFTIFIHDVVPEDAGMYYCVLRKVTGGVGDRQSGLGTKVLVYNILVQQPHGPIYVQSGTVLTLECKVTGSFRAGDVKWFKGEGARRKLIFSTYTLLDRVARKDEDSETDFTILLHDIVPEDAGMYYCVKQKRISEGGGDLQSGLGTEVFVDQVDYRIVVVAVVTVSVFLVLSISGAAVYFCVKKRRGRSRSRHASRPETPLPEIERTPSKDLNAGEIVYAKLEHSKIPQTPKPGNPEVLCEYATIQTGQHIAG